MSDSLLWPGERLAEALDALARHAGVATATDALPAAPAAVLDGGAEAGAWIEWAAGHLGAEALPVQAGAREFDDTLAQAAPALVRVRGLRDAATCGWLLLVGRTRGGALRVLAPDGRVQRCPAGAVRQALLARHEAPHRAEVERLLDTAEVPPARRAGARRALLDERLAGQALDGLWLLRAPVAQGLAPAWREARLAPRLATLALLLVAGYAAELQGWRLIGGAALDGRLDTGWLAAWVLLVLSLVPLSLGAGVLRAGLLVDAARLLKQRLFAGALKLDLDSVRRLGAGQWLSRVMESQSLESAVLAGVLGGGVALIELVCAAWVLGWGAAPAAHLAWLAGCAVLTVVLAARLRGRLLRWMAARLAATHALVERMVGHRTRLAQERAARRTAEEDAETLAVVQATQALDRAVLPLAAWLPGGWMIGAFALLGPAFVHGGPAAPLAVSLGGILFAHRALGGLAGALAALGTASAAWRQIGPLWHAALAPAAAGPFVEQAAVQQLARARGTPVLQADRLHHHYRAEGEAVLQGADLTLRAGERVLIEGPSGGGKSTLAMLLAGLRVPQSGALRIGGLDRPTLADGWQRLATAAPQFHENHVLAGTLAFNLLLGRDGAHGEAELDEARTLCEELGLGPLLEGMPAGLQQRVGEGGWQLSHGEQSRVFLARALLQRAPVTVLDESFGALDPATLRRCLDTVLRRTGTLVVIAHP